MRSIRRQIRRQHPITGAEMDKWILRWCLKALIWGAVGVTVFVLMSVLIMTIFGQNSGTVACIIAVAAAALWAYRSLILPGILVWRQYRQRQLQRANRQPIDKITRHLERGEIPYLADDGEIIFEKRPKHLPPQHDDL